MQDSSSPFLFSSSLSRGTSTSGMVYFEKVFLSLLFASALDQGHLKWFEVCNGFLQRTTAHEPLHVMYKVLSSREIAYLHIATSLGTVPTTLRAFIQQTDRWMPY